MIVGASAAGLAAAETLRREGFDGSVTLVGQEPHLPYDRPPLSKQVLTGAWGTERLTLRRGEDIDALGLDLRLATSAAALSPGARTVALTDGTELRYDGLVIATGVRPRLLPAATRTACTCCAPWRTPPRCGTDWPRAAGWW